MKKKVRVKLTLFISVLVVALIYFLINLYSKTYSSRIENQTVEEKIKQTDNKTNSRSENEKIKQTNNKTNSRSPKGYPKAYGEEYYSGKTETMTVNFTLGDGYTPASEIKTIDNKTKKASRFLPEDGFPDNDNKMKFYHYTTSGKTFQDYFILDGIEDGYENDSLPAKLYGRYYYKGESFSITLSKL